MDDRGSNRDAASRTARMAAARSYATANGLDRRPVDPNEAWLGVVAAGKTFHDVHQALRDLGLDDTALGAGTPALASEDTRAQSDAIAQAQGSDGARTARSQRP